MILKSYSKTYKILKMQLFYNANIDENDHNFYFDKEESQHIVKVLRKKEGDQLYITNGKGYLFEGKITLATTKRCEGNILNVKYKEKHFYNLHLVVAPTKMNERYEWFLEKAVEIGVDEITPVICQHSERTVVKTERLEKIILSAMKQSLQFHLPKLNEPINALDFFHRYKDEKSSKYIAHCQEEKKVLFSKILHPFPQKLIVLIGPEGDFSNEEIKTAFSTGFQAISLGENRLRTETAAIVACNVVATMATL